MNENKYYTPTMSEFHHGFEYEQLYGYDEEGKEIWRKSVYRGSIEAHKNLQSPFPRWVRVERLTQNDVYSVLKEHFGDSVSLGRQDNEAQGYLAAENGLVHSVVFNHRFDSVSITKDTHEEGDVKAVFNGWLRNKSELKRILCQLGIIY